MPYEHFEALLCNSGYFMFHQVAPSTTTYKDSTFCSQSILRNLWISEQSAINSAYDINWQVLITETWRVHRAVRAQFLSVNTRSSAFSVIVLNSRFKAEQNVRLSDEL
jgi:hypothetical protein